MLLGMEGQKRKVICITHHVGGVDERVVDSNHFDSRVVKGGSQNQSPDSPKSWIGLEDKDKARGEHSPTIEWWDNWKAEVENLPFIPILILLPDVDSARRRESARQFCANSLFAIILPGMLSECASAEKNIKKLGAARERLLLSAVILFGESEWFVRGFVGGASVAVARVATHLLPKPGAS